MAFVGPEGIELSRLYAMNDIKRSLE